MTVYVCDECDNQSQDVAFCPACHTNYCDQCWQKRVSHKKGLPGPLGIPHERVDPAIVQQLKDCMAEPTEEDEHRRHRDDEDTTWFGVEKNAVGSPILAEYRRYAAIMMQSSNNRPQARYPGLVSFVGQTGAGKSSLINLLIDLESSPATQSDTATDAPVIGRSSSTQPTSADVHLYMCPSTIGSDRPILYADCEGFEGGDRNPIAAMAASSDHISAQSGLTTAKQKLVQKFAQSTKRILKWATRDSNHHEDRSKRGYAVSEMYPRIFYAFSDVVVFVLDNPRTMEVVVERLLEWSDANYSRSVNQSSKPHAIIALNRSNNDTHPDQWSTINATANLLTMTSARIEDNPTFVRYANTWKRTSQYRIGSMGDLLRCYYSTVHVVRLPDKSRYELLNQQRQQLHDVIEKCCSDSYNDKFERDLLMDADEFGLYLSLAFDHFSETLDKPFDFVEASLKRIPPAETLSDNILIFARRIAGHYGLEGRIIPLFQSLTRFTASCILLDSVRKQRIGRPEAWFGVRDEKSFRRSGEPPTAPGWSEMSYRAMCRKAFTAYWDYDVPCAYEVKSMIGRKLPCSQRRKFHGSSHRAKDVLRTADEPGRFCNKQPIDKKSWEEDVLNEVVQLHEQCRRRSSNDFRQAVVRAHRDLVRDVYRRKPGSNKPRLRPFDFKRNSICVSCLGNPPQHQLDCDHIICTECARDFGTRASTYITVEECPLGCVPHWREEPFEDTRIETPPPFTGLRILTLDGGGIRGMVELQILKAVEKEIGVRLQKFFDLVVGTSTGGIIALGFGRQMWPLDKCIQKFRRMAPLVFAKRKGQDTKIFKNIQLAFKHSRYETTPMEKELQKLFGEDVRLFTGPGQSTCLHTAVLAASSSGSNAWVLASYNASPSRGPRYSRYRPDEPPNEIHTWEAARSTSAAPGFFKPYALCRDGLRLAEFIDGAMLHNNPIEVAIEEGARLSEMYRLNKIPDLILSVGTGHQGQSARKQKEHSQQLQNHLASSARPTWLRNLFTMISYQIEMNLDADKRYSQVHNERRELRGRLRRINPELKMGLPQLDAIDKVDDLAYMVPRLVAKDTALRSEIESVACALVASTFYFERDGVPQSQSSSSTTISGYIVCRLPNGMEDMANLGRFIQRASGASFIIYNEPKNIEDMKINVPTEIMIEEEEFEEPKVRITILGDDAMTTVALRLPGLCSSRKDFPISGFPRPLMKNDFAPQ